MPIKGIAVHVVTTQRKVGDKVYKTHLLSHSYRVGDQVKAVTLANLSALHDGVIEEIKLDLKGEATGPANGQLEWVEVRSHGHAYVVVGTMRRWNWTAFSPPATAGRRIWLSLWRPDGSNQATVGIVGPAPIFGSIHAASRIVDGLVKATRIAARPANEEAGPRLGSHQFLRDAADRSHGGRRLPASGRAPRIRRSATGTWTLPAGTRPLAGRKLKKS
jgi:hypothetical protein